MPSNSAAARAARSRSARRVAGVGSIGRQLRAAPTASVDQRAGEVAAVDGRDVGGRQRRQRPRVVPVQQVALEAFEAFDGRQRRVDPVGQLVGVDEAEVVRRDASRAAPCRCWSATCGARRSAPARSGRCRAAARDRPAPHERLEVAPRLARDRLRGTRGPPAPSTARRVGTGRLSAYAIERRGRPQREHRQRRRPARADGPATTSARLPTAIERARDHLRHEHAQARRPAAVGAGRGRLPLEQAALA